MSNGEDGSVELPMERFIRKLDQLRETIEGEVKEKLDDVADTCEDNKEHLSHLNDKTNRHEKFVKRQRKIFEGIDAETIDTLKTLANAINRLTNSVIGWLKKIFWLLLFALIANWLFPELSLDQIMSYFKFFG